MKTSPFSIWDLPTTIWSLQCKLVTGSHVLDVVERRDSAEQNDDIKSSVVVVPGTLNWLHVRSSTLTIPSLPDFNKVSATPDQRTVLELLNPELTRISRHFLPLTIGLDSAQDFRVWSDQRTATHILVTRVRRRCPEASEPNLSWFDRCHARQTLWAEELL